MGDNGFVTVSPDTRHGTAAQNQTTANFAYAQEFTCGGIGAQNITEIGLWRSADAGQTPAFQMAIFEDDAANACPGAKVTNSDSGELSSSDTNVVKISFTYISIPQVTGGLDYWLAYQIKDGNGNTDHNTTGGTSLRNTTHTYPTWPDGDDWHTHTDQTNDYGIYAVYEAAGGGDIEVSAGTDSLILTEKVAVINAETSIQAGIDTLVLSEKAATINAEINVQGSTDALILTANTAGINAEINIQASIDALILTELQATVEVGGNVEVEANTDALVLSEKAATINAEINVQSNLDILTLTENQANINIGINVAGDTDSLLLSAFAATINAERNILAKVDALILTKYEAGVSVGGKFKPSIFKSKIFHSHVSDGPIF